jgi:hypothetical protein
VKDIDKSLTNRTEIGTGEGFGMSKETQAVTQDQHRDLDDPWWLDHPVKVGELLHVMGETRGVNWVAAIQADKTEDNPKDIGWIHIVGLSIGTYGAHNVDEATMNRIVNISPLEPSLFRDLDQANRKSEMPSMNRILGDVDKALWSFETTRRIRRDLDSGVRTIRSGNGLSVITEIPGQIQIAAEIHALCKKYGRNDWNELIARAFGCSVKTAELRISAARKRGLIAPVKKTKNAPAKKTAAKHTTKGVRK